MRPPHFVLRRSFSLTASILLLHFSDPHDLFPFCSVLILQVTTPPFKIIRQPMNFYRSARDRVTLLPPVTDGGGNVGIALALDTHPSLSHWRLHLCGLEFHHYCTGCIGLGKNWNTRSMIMHPALTEVQRYEFPRTGSGRVWRHDILGWWAFAAVAYGALAVSGYFSSGNYGGAFNRCRS
jgi:hypothetical protein